jgi:hypothetical protein
MEHVLCLCVRVQPSIASPPGLQRLLVLYAKRFGSDYTPSELRSSVEGAYSTACMFGGLPGR